MIFLRDAKRRDRAKRDHHQPGGCENGGNHRANIGQHRTAHRMPVRRFRQTGQARNTAVAVAPAYLCR